MPLGSRIICYVRNGRTETDGWTKATLTAPFHTVGDITSTVGAIGLYSHIMVTVSSKNKNEK